MYRMFGPSRVDEAPEKCFSRLRAPTKGAISLQEIRPHPAQGLRRHQQVRGDIGQRCPLDDLGLLLQQPGIALIGGLETDHVHLPLREDERLLQLETIEPADLKTLVGQFYEAIVWKAIQDRRLDRLHQYLRRNFPQEALDAEEEGVLVGEVFRQVLVVFEIELANHSLIDETHLILNLSFLPEERVFLQFRTDQY